MPPSIDRRLFLRAAGATLALPLFESALPRASAAGFIGASATPPPKRLVCVGNPFGMYPPAFYPAEAGAEYVAPALLAPLEPHRARFTLFSHLDHAVSGGHDGARAFLSGVRPIHAGAMPERNITIDQKAAEFVGAATRVPVLNLCLGGTWEMCWTRDAVRVPPIGDPRRAFDLLFVEESVVEATRLGQALDRDQSILDALRGQARAFEQRLGGEDRCKFEEYLAAVRDVEKRLAVSEAWLHEPKPEVEAERPEGGARTAQLALWFDLIALALQTDSTRVATLEITAPGATNSLDLAGSYHKYSHHGSQPDLIDGLMRIERYQTVELARFLDVLARTPDPSGEGVLLDHTMVLFGSGLGNGNSHSCLDLPLLVAGGRFKHGRHVACPAEAGRRTPLCNLYLTLLQEFGLEIESFGTSTGTMSELLG